MNYFEVTQDKYPSLCGDEVVNLSAVSSFYGKDFPNTDYPYRIHLVCGGGASHLSFKNVEERNAAFKDLTNATKNTSLMNNNTVNSTVSTVTADVKNFIKENRQIVYWLVLALITDHLFLNGQLTTKIKNIMQTLLNKAEEAITGKPTVTVAATTAESTPTVQN